MEPDSSTGAVGPPLAELPSHGYFGLDVRIGWKPSQSPPGRACFPGFFREPEDGIVHQQPPRRLPWVLYPACRVLDGDFFSSISPLEQKRSSEFQHAQRLAERGLFVGKEHDAELAHDCVKSGVLEGQSERISLLPPDAFRTGVRLSTVEYSSIRASRDFHRYCRRLSFQR